ncbi:MAG: hypothetical protein R6U44_08780 [Archaeoglobaceae archaeon]
MRIGFEVDNSRLELSAREKLLGQNNLKEWFDGLPEFFRREESVDVLALVYFVEKLNEKEN